ncbi:geranylgeranyl reductase family protein [bacterium]|nr:geranylgeranyl reductase family protein [candidate division CSSED10-310 bacterium]
MWDVIVVGMGPAGSTAARVAAQHGMNVLGIDRARFPRHKPCAAGLTGRAARLLPLSPEQYQEVSVKRIRIMLGDNPPIKIDSPANLMTTTRRDVLDTALLKHAVDAGVRIIEGCRVNRITTNSRSVEVFFDGGSERTHRLIGCDGANSIVRRILQSKHPRCYPAWEAEYRLPDDIDAETQLDAVFDLGVVRRGYGWIFPKKRSVSVGLAGLFESRKTMEKAFQDLLKHIPGHIGWECIRKTGHTIPVYNSRNIIAGDRVLLAGDAGSLVDPFLGEGLYYALRSGDIAGRWVAGKHDGIGEGMNGYQTIIKETIGRELVIAGRLARIVYSVPGWMHHMAAHHPSILFQFADCLANDNGYTGFLKTLPFPWKLAFGDYLLRWKRAH